MALDLEEITGSALRILPNRNSVARLQRFDPYEKVRVGKLGPSARTGVGLDHGSPRTAVLYHLKSPAQRREEGQPVFQDNHITTLFLF